MLIGGLNIVAPRPSPVKPALYVAFGAGHQNWRATRDAVWRDLWGRPVEIQMPSSACIYAPDDAMSTSDTVFISLPGWATRQ
eukprot:7581755-Pyramimonas_sp.AAC.1